jgi:Flp pilus assembly pilin Flp
MFRRIWQDESGVAMTEYIIVLVLVAIAAITVVSVFGEKIRGMFRESSEALPGVSKDPDGDATIVQ